MALTRLFISTTLRAGQELMLDSEQAHYIGRALRLRAGDVLSVFSAESGEFAATVIDIGKSSARLAVGEHIDTATESPLRIHLVQGVSRGDRMDTVVQKATELGVKRITPVLTEYGVVKLGGDRAKKRRDHWQKIAWSACEQSGRVRPPLIDPPLPLKTWFGGKSADADVDLVLQPGAATAMVSLTTPQTKVCLLIGPEGGFSDNEYDDAEVAGFLPVSLGPRVLRTETAALAAVAVAQTLWGDLASAATVSRKS
jgi:16S rRNA (uracil1498-N3)-methyltransferase